jgi:hypothetical protein
MSALLLPRPTTTTCCCASSASPRTSEECKTLPVNPRIRPNTPYTYRPPYIHICISYIYTHSLSLSLSLTHTHTQTYAYIDGGEVGHEGCWMSGAEYMGDVRACMEPRGHHHMPAHNNLFFPPRPRRRRRLRLRLLTPASFVRHLPLLSVTPPLRVGLGSGREDAAAQAHLQPEPQRVPLQVRHKLRGRQRVGATRAGLSLLRLAPVG